MPAATLDVREIAPKNRHSQIFEAFDGLESGEELQLINDHEPRPLFYELQAERESFDADSYRVEQRADDEFVATLPKR
ncbi:MAG: DUF2249 domain-containing protein [Haloferacaceae archaeon]